MKIYYGGILLLGSLLTLFFLASCKNADVNRGERQLDSCMVTEEVAACLSADDSIVVMKDIAKCDSMIRLEKDTNVLFMLYQQKLQKTKYPIPLSPLESQSSTSVVHPLIVNSILLNQRN